jgi:dTDP-4-dehydrorhamnose reductase
LALRETRLKALITGAGGLLGSELSSILSGVSAYSHEALDVTDETQLWRALTHRRVEVVFHCAAMTDVDACEAQPAKARAVNAFGARCVASICASLGIYVVTISTDYVFDGRPGQQLVEDSQTRPLSVYGRTKREGEVGVQDVNPNAAIVRTSWLYGRWRETFVDRVLEKGAAGQTMAVSSDQASSPTWVQDLAQALVRLAARRPAGIFHLTGEGAVARDVWARATLETAGYDTRLVQGVTGYPAPARRPRYSALTNARARAMGISLPPWRESLDAYVGDRDGANATVASA